MTDLIYDNKLKYIKIKNDTEITISGLNVMDYINVIIPDLIDNIPVTEISNDAFNGSNIKSIDIPNSITLIGESAFSNCKNLDTVNIDYISNLKIINANAFSSSSIKSINIPDNVTTIGVAAFNECKSLSNVNIRDTSKLVYILSKAFSSTLITTINIPANVNLIMAFSFQNCNNLSTIYFMRPKPPGIQPYAFDTNNIINGYYYDTFVNSWKNTIIDNITLTSIPKLTITTTTTSPTSPTSTSSPTSPTSTSVSYEGGIKKTNYINYINYILLVLIIISILVIILNKLFLFF